jgi:hypothetical protein
MERFLFHSEAYALTGRFTVPFDEVIPVQAMATLPLTGGYGSVQVENFDFRRIVSFRRATASVSGSQSRKDRDNRGPLVSRATIEVEDFNVLGMVTAGRIFASVSTSIPFSGEEASLYVHAGFDDLRIAGQPVKLEIDTEYFNRFPVWSALTAEVAKNAPKGLSLPVGSSFRNDVLGFTLARGSVRGGKPTEISIPNFGTISLAELFITPYARRVSMIRIELGCPEEGRLEIGGAGGNGAAWP